MLDNFYWLTSSFIQLLSDFIVFVVNLGLYLRYAWQNSKKLPEVNDPILLLSATRLLKNLKEHKLTSEQIIRSYISRQKAVNPILNAIAEQYYDDALIAAKKADKLLKDTDKDHIEELFQKYPLLGIPFTCKDLYDIEGKRTTWGSWRLRNNVATKTHPVMQILFDAGAILIAKTTVPEGCVFIESVNPIQGTTNNPYDTRRNAGGSSGGEGALLASAASIIGIGSDLAGSIRVPSALDGIYGMKPSIGAFPLAELVGNPVEPLWNSFGPMCRYAEDVELVLKVFCFGARAQHVCRDPDLQITKILSGVTDAIPWVPRIQETNQKLAKKVVNFLHKKYSDVDIEDIDLTEYRRNYIDTYVANYDAYPVAQRTPDRLKANMLACGTKPFHAIIEVPKYLLGKSHHYLASIVMYHFFKRKYTSQEHEEYAAKLKHMKEQFNKQLSWGSFIIEPAWPHLARFHHAELATPSLAHTAIYNLFDVPCIVCPMGLNDNGLPQSVSIIGSHGSEFQLLKIAKEIEQEFGGWKMPK